MAIIAILVIAIAVIAIRRTNLKTQKHEPCKQQAYSSKNNNNNCLDDWKPADTTKLVKSAPPPDPILGYSNLPTWEVKGKRISTGRMNKREYAASTAEKAKALALAEGLVEPLEVKLADFESKHFESSAPDGSSGYDNYELFNSADAHDVDPVTKGFWNYATQKEIHLSWFTGRNQAANRVYATLTPHEKAELFGYAVYCSLHGQELGNVLEQNSPLFENFADAAEHRQDIITSIMKRDGSDIWEPSTRSNAYRFAVGYFEKNN